MRQMKELELEEKRLANQKLQIEKDHEMEMAKMELEKKKMESRVCVVL